MREIVYLLAAFAGACMLVWSIRVIRRRRRNIPIHPIQLQDREVLENYVLFYTKLTEKEKIAFEYRMLDFLSTTTITGINIEVERMDELLIAASAIIPIFHFPWWRYINLHEILLYPAPFDHAFNQEGEERTIAGMVGDGPYQNMMILSRHDLRYGFMNRDSKSNTAIHEFVHLIDKSDGAVDGLPEALIAQPYVIPWLTLMQENIEKIRNAESDINPYGATNQAEFFAVASEYFFEQPDQLEEKHPELFHVLKKIFGNHQ